MMCTSRFLNAHVRIRIWGAEFWLADTIEYRLSTFRIMCTMMCTLRFLDAHVRVPIWGANSECSTMRARISCAKFWLADTLEWCMPNLRIMFVMVCTYACSKACVCAHIRCANFRLAYTIVQYPHGVCDGTYVCALVIRMLVCVRVSDVHAALVLCRGHITETWLIINAAERQHVPFDNSQ